MTQLPGTPAHAITRRQSIRVLIGAGAAAFGIAKVPQLAGAASASGRVVHPDPRAGVTAEHVLPEGEVPRKARKAYAAAREIPGVLDGLYCHCDCGKRDELRSLLSCFETKMPASCGYCREEAELALKLHHDGKTLDEIRAAVDKEFG